MERSQLFDPVAEAYDRVRPGYPEELVDDVLAFAGAGAGARALEVGPGPGTATRLFLRRGLAIDAVEPGARLAARLRERVVGTGAVRVVEARFEDAPVEAGAYALVYGAQSFHWVDPAVRYAKSAEALAAGGTLAIFWQSPQPGDGAAHAAVRDAYRQLVPDLAVRPADGGWASHVADEVDASGLFGSVHAVRYPWRGVYSAAEYVALLGTYSDHLQVEETRRRSLFAAIEARIDEHGGRIEVPYVLRLYLARKKTPGGVRTPPRSSA